MTIRNIDGVGPSKGTGGPGDAKRVNAAMTIIGANSAGAPKTASGLVGTAVMGAAKNI